MLPSHKPNYTILILKPFPQTKQYPSLKMQTIFYQGLLTIELIITKKHLVKFFLNLNSTYLNLFDIKEGEIFRIQKKEFIKLKKKKLIP